VILDLSAVSDGLINLVKNEWSSAPIWAELGVSGPTFTPNFTGLAPDAIRDDAGPQLSLFLYHVESDNAQESNFWTTQMLASPGQAVRYLPLALNLYYLLSAFSEGSYAEEQQAMSVAMRIFHANAAVRSDSTPTPAWSLTLTMEHRSYDELSRPWQATTAALRLGVVYRAAVLFITPDEPGDAPKDTEVVNVEVGATLTVTDPDVVPITSP
jgi:Pvc16 N-terminal domain